MNSTDCTTAILNIVDWLRKQLLLSFVYNDYCCCQQYVFIELFRFVVTFQQSFRTSPHFATQFNNDPLDLRAFVVWSPRSVTGQSLTKNRKARVKELLGETESGDACTLCFDNHRCCRQWNDWFLISCYHICFFTVKAFYRNDENSKRFVRKFLYCAML